MDKENLFESILKDSESHTSKFEESIFGRISEAVDKKEKDLGVFEYEDEGDYDYSDDGYADYFYGVKDSDYSVTVTVVFSSVDYNEDCNCDTPCNYGCSPDNIRYESTGAWSDGVDITPAYEYTVTSDDSGEEIVDHVSAEEAINCLAEKGVTVTLDDLNKISSDALSLAESGFTDAVNDDPESYLCDCDNCDCDYDNF